MNGVISIAGKGAAVALDYANNASKASEKLADMASRSRATALDALQKMKAAPDGMTAKSFEAAWRSASTDAANAETLAAELGNTKLGSIATPTLDLDRGLPLLRNLPIAGTLVSGGLAAASILQARSPGKVIAKTATSGAAAWAAAEAVAEITPEGRLYSVLATAAGFGAGEGVDYLTGQAYDAVVKDANGHYDHLGEE